MAILIITTNYNYAAEAIKTEFSGFARFVAGQTDQSGVSASNYDNDITIGEDSVIGLQGQIQFNDQFSATALGLGRDSKKGSDLEWLYLNYRPTSAWNIKIGKMQTPLYSLSDSLDVGYSYPWILAPKTVYTDFVVRSFHGVDVRYAFVVGELTAHIEAYYGTFEDDLTAGDTSFDTKVDDISGLIAELRVANFKFRASYHSGDVDITIGDIDSVIDILSANGFEQSANSIDPDGLTEFYQMGTEYDSLSYFLNAEWIMIKFESNFLREVKGYYLTYGHYFGPVSAMITYARREDADIFRANEIPIGVSEQLDLLAFQYDLVIDNHEQEDVQSWTLGLRWDFRKNLAVKAEVTQLNPKNDVSSSIIVDDGVNFDRRVNLMMFAVEWVF